MKFDDVKKLPPELQPLALEMAQLTTRFAELYDFMQKLDEDHRMVRSLVQDLLHQLSEEGPDESSGVPEVETAAGNPADVGG